MGNGDMRTVPENSGSHYKRQLLLQISNDPYIFASSPSKLSNGMRAAHFHCIPRICDTPHFQIGTRHQTNEGITPRRTELALLVFQFLCEIGNGSQTTNDVFKMVF